MALGVYTKVLKDDFNRADEEPATGWTDAEAGGMRIVSNALTLAVGGGGAYWAADPSLSNFEAYVTAQVAPAGADYLKWRFDGTNGYQLQFGNGDVVRLPGSVFIFTTSAETLVAGGELAIQHIGSAIEIFLRPSGGSWASIGSGTDGTHTGGRFQPAFFGTLALDSFSLGTYSPSDTPFPPLGRGATW